MSTRRRSGHHEDAVATMFLSKRWHSIWTMVPTLEYKDSYVDDYYYDEDEEDYYNYFGYKESKKSVWKFLDKSMQLHKAPVINYLGEKLGPSCPTDVDVVKWVANDVSRCLLELEFKLLWSADPTSLPKSLYSCESLVKLTLSHKIFVDVPSPACLPSLIELYLNYVVYKDEDSQVRFLSSCPVLKCLYVSRKKNDNVKKFTVRVPSLLELSYTHYLYGNDVEYTMVIDTPKLEDFHIYGFSGDSRLIENMPFLKCAFICFDPCANEKLLSYVSLVSSLELFLSDEMLVCCSTLHFSRLIKLKIRPQESADWLQPLIPLLENSPKLKDLWVDCDFSSSEDIKLSWNQPISIPGCLSSQLEIFMWKDYGGTKEEEQFLTYVLANSKCLNTATINLIYKLSREEKYLMKEKLKDIPRVSTTSQLSFKDIPMI